MWVENIMFCNFFVVTMCFDKMTGGSLIDECFFFLRIENECDMSDA